jgi:S1-C subfamily serine protease
MFTSCDTTFNAMLLEPQDPGISPKLDIVIYPLKNQILCSKQYSQGFRTNTRFEWKDTEKTKVRLTELLEDEIKTNFINSNSKYKKGYLKPKVELEVVKGGAAYSFLTGLTLGTSSILGLPIWTYKININARFEILDSDGNRIWSKRYTEKKLLFYGLYRNCGENTINNKTLEIFSKILLNLKEDISRDINDITEGLEKSNIIPNDKNPNPEPIASSGTGFAINSNGYIATNYHVIEGYNRIVVKGVNGDDKKSYSARVIIEDKRNDLAILKIDKSLGVIPYGMQKSTVGNGNVVYALGYPLTTMLGTDVKFTTGNISSSTGFKNDPTYYQHSASLQPGNSGGPLFNQEGDLVAINTLGVNQKKVTTEGIFFSVKTRYLINLMDEKEIKQPNNIGLKNYSIPEQFEKIKNFVYLIEVN